MLDCHKIMQTDDYHRGTWPGRRDIPRSGGEGGGDVAGACCMTHLEGGNTSTDRIDDRVMNDRIYDRVMNDRIDDQAREISHRGRGRRLLHDEGGGGLGAVHAQGRRVGLHPARRVHCGASHGTPGQPIPSESIPSFRELDSIWLAVFTAGGGGGMWWRGDVWGT